MDEFWIKNPQTLIDKYYEIIPTKNMTRPEYIYYC